MLSSRKASDGMTAASQVIHILAADRWATFAKATLAVSAKVEGKLIVDEEQFEVLMQKELDCVSISIYWEESGYKAYKALGLFGKMDKLYTTSSLRLADATTLINQQLSVRRYGKNFLLRAYEVPRGSLQGGLYVR